MREINLPPFYVGQRVVAIVDSSPILKNDLVPYKKGDEFIVSELKKSPILKQWHCQFVGRPLDEYYGCQYFAPIQENFQSISLEKILEEETKLIGVN